MELELGEQPVPDGTRVSTALFAIIIHLGYRVQKHWPGRPLTLALHHRVRFNTELPLLEKEKENVVQRSEK